MPKVLAPVFSATLNMTIPATSWQNGGQRVDMHKRYVAAQVAAIMANVPFGRILPCIHCGESFDWCLMGDCDRVTPDKDYVLGNIVMICRSCNESRGHLQKARADMGGAARYADDVADASRLFLVMVGWVRESVAVAWIRGQALPQGRQQRVGNLGTGLAALSRSPYWNA